MPTATFNTSLQVAIEDTGNVAPGASTNPFWWQGGRWIPLTTDGLPDLQDQQAIIFPSGAAGNRNINNRAPVVGRKWSDGGFSFPTTQDFIIALLYGALGTLSSNSVPSTDATIKAGAALADGTSNVVDKTSQPSDGGAILRFRITGLSVGGGWISISGIDPEGNGASETISVASAGSFYSRNSYSAIGPSSIVIYTDSDGTAEVTGVQYWEHTISPGPSNPTLSVERIGDPSAGAASKSYMHSSMVVQEFTLNFPAAQRDGLMTGEVSFEGYPTVTCNAASYAATSPVGVWPSWGLSVTRDNATWNRITNAAFTLMGGNRNYRAAAGTQVPQGTFFGPREVTGSMDVILDDEGEFNRWRGASSHQMHWNIDTPWKLTSTQNQALSCSFLSTYIEDMSLSDEEDMLMMSLDFRTIENAEAGVARFKVICGVPGVAFGNTVD